MMGTPPGARESRISPIKARGFADWLSVDSPRSAVREGEMIALTNGFHLSLFSIFKSLMLKRTLSVVFFRSSALFDVTVDVWTIWILADSNAATAQ
jgi:hypothetical protein